MIAGAAINQNFTLSTFCQDYHFREITKMIIHIDIL